MDYGTWDSKQRYVPFFIWYKSKKIDRLTHIHKKSKRIRVESQLIGERIDKKDSLKSAKNVRNQEKPFNNLSFDIFYELI